MNIFKTLVCFAAVVAVTVYGCRSLYDTGAYAAGEGESDGEVVTSEGTDAIPEAAFDGELPPAEEVPLPAARGDCELSLSSGSTVTFSFLGDCLLASESQDTRPDAFRAYAEVLSPSYFLEKAAPCYQASDFVIANNECVFTDRSLAKAQKSGEAYWFSSPTSCAQILSEGGVDIVSIANNHTRDYGEEGYRDTAEALENAGITWGDLDNPVYVEKDGITFGIICTGLFSRNYDPLITPVIEEVKRNSDIQIMFFHGGTEKQHEPDDWLVEMCHKYADMGVDLIVGSHPHVLIPMERYNGVDIIYSIGNFCYGGNRLPENRTVILTETFTFDRSGKYVSQDESFIPFHVYSGEYNNWQPSPITDLVEISKVRAYMYGSNQEPFE